jgi:hypothetical protein
MHAMNRILVSSYGVSLETPRAPRIGELVASLAVASDLKVDVVSAGIPGLKGFTSKKFRKSTSAMDYLEIEPFSQTWVGATERAHPKGDWDVGSIGHDAESFRTRLVFRGSEPRTDPRVFAIFSRLAELNAHYAYSVAVESHLYGLCLANGSTLSGRMDAPTSKNMDILGNSLARGENFTSRIIDVFPLSILNSTHLASRIGGKSLGAMINDESWGRLTLIGVDKWLWKLTVAEMSKARSRLLESDFMLAKY